MDPVKHLLYSKGVIQQFIKEKRVWWYTDFGKHVLKNQSNGLNFTVMSYNILSQALLEGHSYLYHSCNKEILKWDFRHHNLLQELVDHNADIICLQEMEASHYEETFLPCLIKHGYLGLYKKKTGSNVDGCAILYKKRIFRVVTYSAVEYRNSYVRVLDRDQIGLVAVLQPVDPKFQGIKLCVATTHLLFNPRRGDVKFSQLRILLAEIEKYACKSISGKEQKYYPVILCGDMNSEPYSPLYNFITRGFIKFENMMSGNVSGQFTGFNKGRLMVEKYLSLTALGINQNTCYERLDPQAVSHNVSRLKEFPVNDLCTSMNNLHVSRSSSQSRVIDHNVPITPTPGNKSGRFFHPLCFASTYKHYRNDGNREITTFNEDTNCTIDYIFYTVGHTHNGRYSGRQTSIQQNDGQLKHVGSYGLINLSDLKNFSKLPNAGVSSDHLCLISRFLLKL